MAALLGRARLVTLTGAGGVGKTRLALAVAANLLPEYPDGVWLVELAALADPALVPQTLAQTLGLQEQRDRPHLEVLVGYLQHRRVLLVLDNCEHLVGACATLALALLQRCPQLGLLATSREALEVAGEVLYRVPSLSVPDMDRLAPPDQLGHYEAVQLFLERAQARRGDFGLTTQNAPAVAQVSTRLDGMPLALELAAARLGALPVEAIASRLDDRFRLLTGGPRTALPRQQTLRATLDWSWDLLGEPERLLLRRLSVFAGGCTLEAAETVCGGGTEAWEVLDLLAALVNKSLVQAADVGGELRYRLLETVRQYGQERLDASGETAQVRDRHLDWCVALAEAAAPRLTSAAQALWLERLDREHDNLRAALRWAQERGASELGLRLAGALWRFWTARSYLSEGRSWLEGALADGVQGSPAARALALFGAGVMVWRQGDLERATDLEQEALGLFRDLGDKAGAAYALSILAQVNGYQGDYAREAALAEECLTLRRELGDLRGIALCLGYLGDVAQAQGDYTRAMALHEEALELQRGLANSHGTAGQLSNLGEVAYERGDLVRAMALLEEALALFRDLGDTGHIAMSLTRLGMVADQQGDQGRAVTLIEEGLALFREVGEPWPIAVALFALGRVVHKQGDHQRAVALLKEGLLLSRTSGFRHHIATGLESLAWAVAASKHSHTPAQLGGAAEALREALGVPLPRDQQAGHDQVVAAMRDALGEVGFAAAWAEGRALSLEAAIALALDSNQAG